MDTKKKTAPWRIDPNLITKIAEIAAKEKRSAAGQVEYFLEKAIQNYEEKETGV